MKKILILGGSHSQIPAIKTAKEMGLYVITCDYLEDNPGHQLAHEYYNVSTTDKEAVLSLAKSLKVDGIVCYATDSAAPTAAYVSERVGLPTHPYKSVEILTNKELFRDFQRKHNFHVPKAKGYESIEDAYADFNSFKMPVMIKPVDSSGSRGVAKIDRIEELKGKAENALSFSNVKRFIIEEYIENSGYHVGGDGFSNDGRIIFRAFCNEHFPSNESSNPFVPIGSSWPCTMSESIQTKIHDEVQRILRLLNMKTGSYNFDIRVDDKENIYIIEIGPRNGGDLLPEAINYATGINLIEYTIKASLGEDCNDLLMAPTEGYWSSYILNSQKDGVFKEVEIKKELQELNIVEEELLINVGESITALSGANDKIGTIILKFASMDEMLEKMENMEDWVNIIIDESYSPNGLGVK